MMIHYSLNVHEICDRCPDSAEFPEIFVIDDLDYFEVSLAFFTTECSRLELIIGN